MTLAEAARYNDAIAEERGLAAAVAEAGLDMEELLHVADQRALRAVLIGSRGAAALKLLDPVAPSAIEPPLTHVEKAQLAFYTSLYMDGITLGAKAART